MKQLFRDNLFQPSRHPAAEVVDLVRVLAPLPVLPTQTGEGTVNGDGYGDVSHASKIPFEPYLFVGFIRENFDAGAVAIVTSALLRDLEGVSAMGGGARDKVIN